MEEPKAWYTKPGYGTIEFYAELFTDILADIQHDSPELGDNLVNGFKLALDDWREYHRDQVNELDRIKNQVDDKIN